MSPIWLLSHETLFLTYAMFWCRYVWFHIAMDFLVAETLFRDILITFSLFVIHLNLVMGII
jgi:hypothetical protein